MPNTEHEPKCSSSLFQNEKNLLSTIQSSDTVTVCRSPEKQERISSNDLVPGDVFVIPAHGCELLCDAVLLSGSVIGNIEREREKRTFLNGFPLMPRFFFQ